VVTNRAFEPLLKAAAVSDGTGLLDVASRPGTLAAKAAERSARVIGIDISSAMVALARTLHPHLDFREGSAEDLPFAPSSLDCVVSGFGVSHFSKPERVLAEFARVFVPKGRVSLSWWNGFGKNRINGLFFEVFKELGITAPGDLPAGPTVDRFMDPDQFAALLRAARFEVVGVDYISFSHPLKNVDELWDLALGSFVRMSTNYSSPECRRSTTNSPKSGASGAAICIAKFSKFRLPLESSPDSDKSSLTSLSVLASGHVR
jgi:SAM-dependent methyltransferase